MDDYLNSFSSEEEANATSTGLVGLEKISSQCLKVTKSIFGNQ